MIEVRQVLDGQLRAALWECAPPHYIHRVLGARILEPITDQLLLDATAYAEKDPASSGACLTVVRAYTSFKAVLHYRLAHALEYTLSPDPETAAYAALVSSRGKLLSGAEIHHRRQIGARFVLDHGVGTVIGETTRIGDDCYVLGGVTLGAIGISDNPKAKRHPTLGHRVQVGAFAQIFGPVKIGDDVFIGAHCTVKSDVPPRSRLVMQSRLQVERAPTPAAEAIAETGVS